MYCERYSRSMTVSSSSSSFSSPPRDLCNIIIYYTYIFIPRKRIICGIRYIIFIILFDPRSPEIFFSLQNVSSLNYIEYYYYVSSNRIRLRLVTIYYILNIYIYSICYHRPFFSSCFSYFFTYRLLRYGTRNGFFF